MGISIHIIPGDIESGKMFVDCSFDSFTGRVFIDTGANFSSVANLESFKSYQTIGKVRFKSASGVVIEADEISVDKLSIGAMRLSTVRVARLNPDEGFESVLGANVLKQKPFSFEFNSSPSLTLDAIMPTITSSGLVQYENGVFSIPVELGFFSTKGLWDTGAGLTAVAINHIKAIQMVSN